MIVAFVTLCSHCYKIMVINSLKLLNTTLKEFGFWGFFWFFAIWASAKSS